ncbi:MAG: calcineurin-like phosphoesterase [Verrucomicrobiaceae bacterium]|nr:calcineurin-like phosphoesterase [Verrucomicrobiaceae bacterium]
MRDLVIGDIHGYSTALESVLAVVKPDKNDRITFLGDYIDRGPDSCKVLDILMRLGKRTTTRFLQGNHERFLLTSIADPSMESTWTKYGGASSLKSFAVKHAAEVPRSYLQFLEGHPLWIEDENFIFVHAGVNPRKPMERQTEEDLLWTHLKVPPWHYSGKTVVCGHTYVERPVLTAKCCQIDTGIARGGWLTCVNLNDYSFVQADAKGTARESRA